MFYVRRYVVVFPLFPAPWRPYNITVKNQTRGVLPDCISFFFLYKLWKLWSYIVIWRKVDLWILQVIWRCYRWFVSDTEVTAYRCILYSPCQCRARAISSPRNKIGMTYSRPGNSKTKVRLFKTPHPKRWKKVKGKNKSIKAHWGGWGNW